VVAAGTGKVKPRGFDVVTLEYSAWSATGRLFDSTEVTKQPKRTLPFREPPALEEILKTMVAGQKVRLWLPAAQLEQLPSTPAGQVCYEVTLVDITPKQAPPPVPVAVAAPPAKAKQTAGGVHYEVLKAGTGTAHPAKTDRVKMHYTGWRTDGRMFDSSEINDQPATVAVSRLTPGWAEAMTEMVPGERRRLWIPEHLAYAKAPGAPAGMIVMEVELLEIVAAPPPARPQTGQSLVRP
jgi:FKBP-type peptidyl-prolyl cis-trans isomerase